MTLFSTTKEGVAADLMLRICPNPWNLFFGGMDLPIRRRQGITVHQRKRSRRGPPLLSGVGRVDCLRKKSIGPFRDDLSTWPSFWFLGCIANFGW